MAGSLFSGWGGKTSLRFKFFLEYKNKTPVKNRRYVLAGVEGFEPSEWRNQNPLPYHLATPQ